MKIETTKVYRFYSKCFDAKTLRIFRRQMRKTWKVYKQRASPARCFDRHYYLVLWDIKSKYPEMIKLSGDETEALFEKAFSNPIVQVEVYGM